MKKRTIYSAFMLTFCILAPLIGAKASFDTHVYSPQRTLTLRLPEIPLTVTIPELPSLSWQSDRHLNKLPSFQEYVLACMEEVSKAPEKKDSETNPAKDSDNHNSDTMNNSGIENTTDTDENSPAIQGTPLNPDASVYDLDYEFKLKETEQMLFSFANQLLILQHPEGELRMYLYDPLENVVLKKNITNISTSLSQNTIAVSRDELRIYDTADRVFLYFDRDLKEIKRIQVPDDCRTIPSITEKKDVIYYFSGESGDLKEFFVSTQESRTISCGLIADSLTSSPVLIMGDQYLAVTGNSSSPDKPGYITNFISLSENKIVGHAKGSIDLWSTASKFAALLQNGFTQAIYGEPEFSSLPSNSGFLKELLPNDSGEYNCLTFDLKQSLMLTASCHPDVQNNDFGTSSLQVYDLVSGENRYQTELSLLFNERTLAPEIENIVYLPSIHMAAFQYRHDYYHIGLWDLNKRESMSRSSKNYSTEYYSSAAPDKNGIEILKGQAADLNKKYGISIHIAEDCIRDFPGYLAQPVYTTRLIQSSLDILDKALSAYPKNFFRQLNTGQLGTLSFYLGGTITPDGEQSLKNAGGFYFHEGQTQYLTLDITRQNTFENTLYHEISHAIDQFFKTKYQQTGFDLYTDEIWNTLNPPGFSYSFSYHTGSADYDWKFCPPEDTDESIYFTDAYAKTFPSEDRAQIMQYAMNKAQSPDFFKYPHIREKLAYMSKALRSLFDTAGWEELTAWEKPLR